MSDEGKINFEVAELWPSEVTSLEDVICLIAHGTTSHDDIIRLYLTPEERISSERKAWELFFEMAREGRLNLTGLWSNTKTGKTYEDARWNKQRYTDHGPERTYIPKALFEDQYYYIRENIVFPNMYGRIPRAILRWRYGEYKDVYSVNEDMDEGIIEYIEDKKRQARLALNSLPEVRSYSTPYIELLIMAISKFDISKQNQPLHKELVAWFLQQTVDGQEISVHQAKMLATFVRLPEAQRGGNRPRSSR